MAESAQQKTEKPTAKRLRDARREGQVPRSRELSTAAVVGAGVAAIMLSGGHLSEKGLGMMREALIFDAETLGHPQDLLGLLFVRLTQGMTAIVPILLACLAAALLAPSLLGGWNFAGKAIKPDFSRINPLKGLKRLFSSHGLVELCKAVAKFLFVGGIGASYLWVHRDSVMSLGAAETGSAVGLSLHLALGVLMWTTVAIAGIALLDAAYQLVSYKKQLMMSRQEVKDEFKEAEGKPEVKAKIRQMQAQMANRRMMDKVPTADVVITNPTHYAVALKYEQNGARAPVVVAKGKDEIARMIREVAEANKVPMLSAPPLARALFRSVELDAEIPAALYAAVAQVLSYIYQLRQWRGGRNAPVVPVIGDVPGGEPDA